MQKSGNLVDLVKSFHTSIDLQKSASIQPRTSRSKFRGDFIALFIRILLHRPFFGQLCGRTQAAGGTILVRSVSSSTSARITSCILRLQCWRRKLLSSERMKSLRLSTTFASALLNTTNESTIRSTPKCPSADFGDSFGKVQYAQKTPEVLEKVAGYLTIQTAKESSYCNQQ